MPTTMSNNTPPTIESLQRVIKEIDGGCDVLEHKLAAVSSGDMSQAPFPLVGREAEIWLQASASAYQHALEMLSSGSIKTLVLSWATPDTPDAKAR